MLESLNMIGFLPVNDLDAALTFYHHTLGLPLLTKSDGFAMILGTANGGTIRCVLSPDAKPQPFTILGWEAPDIRAAAAALKAKKINPILYPHFDQSPEGIWTAPTGDQVLWFNDPTGNVLSLSQHVSKQK